MYTLLIIANSQGDNLQQEGLNQLSDNRNTALVGDCEPVTSSTTLVCPIQSSVNLEIDNDIYLQRIDVRIRTCNSTVWLWFTYSNQTVDMTNDNLSSPTRINVGQLTFDANISTCVNRFTEVQISVSLCDSQ